MFHDRDPLIQSALAVVQKFANRLALGDAHEKVRCSVHELSEAWAHRQGIEPALDQLRASLQRLDQIRSRGTRRDFVRQSPSVGRLNQALQEQLLPALKSGGYRV